MALRPGSLVTARTPVSPWTREQFGPYKLECHFNRARSPNLSVQSHCYSVSEVDLGKVNQNPETGTQPLEKLQFTRTGGMLN